MGEGRDRREVLATLVRGRVDDLGLGRAEVGRLLGLEGDATRALLRGGGDPPPLARLLSHLVAFGLDVDVTVRPSRSRGRGRLLLAVDGPRGRDPAGGPRAKVGRDAWGRRGVVRRRAR